ncbi:hypothetical protein CA54_07360 [Symmachiella macrocystis]|uniref:Uncharacterized protein n=1 Tax=Symmachiella macrocystis TaxID=2527985 RepID=A0A5C6BN13_9PLAN|nr:hypothetical protein [Symmachiella macrocystis]TWU11924.1 hypothetical protein CA54_07360 [Symmachiella macrocystis]
MTTVGYPKLRLLTSVLGGLAGLTGILLVAVARDFFMHREPTLLSIDYTTIGWVLRIIAVLCGILALVGSLWARPVTRKYAIGKWWYRIVFTIACCAIAYEIAISVVVGIMILGGMASAFSGGGDWGEGFDLFDFGD